MILVGKLGGSPKLGCPFCSASTPYKTDGTLYTLQQLLDLHEVRIKYGVIGYTISMNKDIFLCCSSKIINRASF